MQADYIIVQAGGRGSRLEHLTKNKPKAIVPIENLPMIFHLFHKFPESRFIIIADYKAEVLEKYLRVFSPVKYIVVNATGHTGTCAGIQKACDYIPQGHPLLLIWSDLVLGKAFCMPQEEGDYVGLSGSFSCRWKYENGAFAEEASTEYGVAGAFVFRDKSLLAGVPESGEFVRWLQATGRSFQTFSMKDTREFGVLVEYNKLKTEKCRPFNRIEEKNGHLVKMGIDEQGRRLAVREKEWYRFALTRGYQEIPHIYSYEPFEMEKIEGKNIYEYDQLTYEEKETLLKKMVEALDILHGLSRKPADYFSIWEAYVSKTYKRLEQVRDLIPFADRREICINGRMCRNIFFHWKDVEEKLLNYKPEEFCFIHGDCTFSNMMLRKIEEPVLIDPRGYFGYEELYGDVAYDWAKLYYSIKGNYDQFNLKRFSLDIGEDEIRLEIASSHWEDMEEEFLSLVSKDVSVDYVKLFHAIIWLSLTTYAWEDYDSICGAFYNGLYYLEEIM